MDTRIMVVMLQDMKQRQQKKLKLVESIKKDLEEEKRDK
jgi:hypothetical protein